jgi:hypothetical protein
VVNAAILSSEKKSLGVNYFQQRIFLKLNYNRVLLKIVILNRKVFTKTYKLLMMSQSFRFAPNSSAILSK